MNRETAVTQLKETFRILNDDLNEIQDLYIEKPSGALHRALIRAYSAFIEGTLYQLRQVAIHSAGSTNAIFSAEELMLLKELQASLNKKGEIETKDNYERFLPMLLFTLKQYVRVHGANFEPDTSLAGWVAMRKFVKVRNLFKLKGSEPFFILLRINQVLAQKQAAHYCYLHRYTGVHVGTPAPTKGMVKHSCRQALPITACLRSIVFFPLQLSALASVIRKAFLRQN